ncbi:toxin-antitoxin system YwqK family antitoxin [Flavobacterium sp. TMP13]|uniref:toxin-antitoxin system YwqK family antitoxin n=1 Tax=Flavobacterium sp. TMP13 TaxID=3425950 RepID=UPI003D774C6C
MRKLLFLLLVSCSLFAQDFNKLDSKGLKNGVWKGVYQESKRPRYEGTFLHGKETGIFNYYDDTKKGDIVATRDFSANDGSAYVVFYDQNKNKVSEGKVVNKVLEGEWIYYHQKSKDIMTKENYVKGKLEGLRSVFYSSGKIAEEQFFKNGLKEGPYKKYTENGLTLEESNYNNDLYNGQAVFKNGAGLIISTGNFINGKKAGVWEFYEKGKLVKEVNMSDPKAINQSMIKSKVSPEKRVKPKL